MKKAKGYKDIGDLFEYWQGKIVIRISSWSGKVCRYFQGINWILMKNRWINHFDNL